MIHLKTEAELQIMLQGGKKLRKVVEELRPMIKPGVSTISIDTEAELLMRKNGGESSFNKVPGYKWSTCLPIDEEVVHTPPSQRILKDGDVLTLDIGIYYKGFHTDYADTIIVGSPRNSATVAFLKTGEDTLKKALAQVKTGNYLGTISEVIEKEIYGKHYFILKDLTGHGIGKELHEDPYVPGFVDKPIQKTFQILPGLAIAVEIIYSMGTEKLRYGEGDDWSIKTKDGSLSACFEHTIVITEKGPVVAT